MPETLRKAGVCVVCSAPGVKRCGACHAVTYCAPGCQKRDWTRHKGLCAPLAVTELENRGRGLVATKRMGIGDLVVRDEAVIRVESEADTWRAGEAIQRQVDKLSDEKRTEFFKLTKMQRLLDICDEFVAAAGDNSDQIRKANMASKFKDVTAIFYNNDISGADDSKCLFLTLALLNHSCAPNTAWSRAGDNVRQLELRAIRDIEVGEEITVNYISVEGRYSDTAARQTRLLEGWAFTCVCRLCETKAEDNVKAEIRELQARMTEACDTEVEQIDWALLTSCQEQLLAKVQTLSTAPLLLPRECQSLANLSQLARFFNFHYFVHI